MTAFWVTTAMVVLSALWVFRDVRGRDWSHSGYERWSPAFWASMTLLMWIVIFPFYLFVRRNGRPKVGAGAARHMKRCPDCAELVQRDAMICRFCRYRFDTQRLRRVS